MGEILIKMNMKYIVYLTVCTVNLKIYIGVHQTEDPDVFDGYIGCGVRISVPASYKKSKTPFQFAVNKYGVEKFKRITLRVFESKEEAFALEKLLVDSEFIRRSDTYNTKLGGEGGCPECNKVKVYMYDLNGDFVREFSTVCECNKFFFPDAKSGGHVPRAIRLGHIIQGYQLSYEKVPHMKAHIRKHGSHIKRKIGKYDESGNLLEVFESVTAGRNAGYKDISRALKQGIKAKGFYFRYLEN